MPELTLDDCIELGYIGKAHGTAGEVRAVFDVQDINDYRRRKIFHVARKGEDQLRTIEVRRLKIVSPSEAIIAVVDIHDRPAAETLRGYTLYMPIADLPKLPKGKYYFFEIEGFTVHDATLGTLGTVRTVIEMPQQNIVVMDYKDKEILFPLIDVFVQDPDMEARILPTTLPDGLLEVYMDTAAAEPDDASE
jgi:16S rRNA processing protein RimM